MLVRCWPIATLCRVKQRSFGEGSFKRRMRETLGNLVSVVTALIDTLEWPSSQDLLAEKPFGFLRSPPCLLFTGSRSAQGAGGPSSRAAWK